MWFKRAEKILAQIAHLRMLLEFVEYATAATDRLINTYRRNLRKDPDLVQLAFSSTLAFDLLQFAELYQTYQPEYDMFD